MSESISYETTNVYALEDRASTSGYVENLNSQENRSQDSPETDWSWGDKLTEIVALNAHEIVRCYWMGDAEVTVAEAMSCYSYPPNLTAEDEPFLVAVVEGLLANKVLKTEETEEPDQEESEEEKIQEREPQEKDAGKKNDSKTEVREDKKINPVDEQTQIETETSENNLLTPIASKVEKISKTKAHGLVSAEVKTVGAPVPNELKLVVQNTAKVETARSPLNVPTAINNEAEAEVFKEPQATSQRSARFTKRPLISETSGLVNPGIEADKQAPAFKMPLVELGTNPFVEHIEAPGRPEITKESIEIGTLPKATKIPGPESSMQPIFHLASKATPGESIVWDEAEVETPYDRIEADTIDCEVSISRPTNFAAEEDLPMQFKEPGPESSQLYEDFYAPTLEPAEDNLETMQEAPVFELDGQLDVPWQAQVTEPEQAVQISLAIEEVEDSIVHLAESIPFSDTENTEAINETLDKIIEVPAILEIQNDASIIIEAEVHVEHEELFTEPLERVRMDVAPELIESLAKLTFKRLDIEHEKLETEDEAGQTPSDVTHEIIIKPLAALNNIKKAMDKACVIGRYALRPYILNKLSIT